MWPRLLLHGGTIATLGALFWSYGTLPDRVAIHFNLAGNPDAWASKTNYLILGVVVIGLMWLLFASIPALLKRAPADTINIPDKDYWLAPENIDEFHDIFQGYMFFFGGLTQLFFLGIGVLVHKAQMGQTGLPTGGMVALLAAFTVATIIWIVAMIRRFRR